MLGKELSEYIINEVIEKGDTDAITKNKAAIMEVINAGLRRYAILLIRHHYGSCKVVYISFVLGKVNNIYAF